MSLTHAPTSLQKKRAFTLPCLSRSEWQTLYEQDCGRDYRDWHLSFCRRGFMEVWQLRRLAIEGEPEPTLNLQVHPLAKAAACESH